MRLLLHAGAPVPEQPDGSGRQAEAGSTLVCWGCPQDWGLVVKCLKGQKHICGPPHSICVLELLLKQQQWCGTSARGLHLGPW